jgi:hypothetical protein
VEYTFLEWFLSERIPAVTPAAVSLINVFIEIQAKRFAQAQELLA